MRTPLRRRGTIAGAAIVSMAGLVALGAGPAIADSTISSSGPLTSIMITSDLNCAVNHTGDISGEFYSDTACGTFVAVGGVLFGPASVPAGGGASPRTAWTPVSQSSSGSGTSADPYRIVTVADGIPSGSLVSVVRVTETDSYVVGEEGYRTDVQVANTTGSSQSVVIYRAGDCYLQNSDSGFGRTYPGGGVACVSEATDPSTGNVTGPGSRVEQWYPLTSGSSYFEAFYGTVWGAIGSQQSFPNTCRCDTTADSFGNFVDDIDNGAGLSWAPTIAAGASVTESHLTSFSPTGVVPLTTAKTADSSTATAGGTDGYTITVSNNGGVDVPLTTVTDTLPAGFSYTSGSTTGATTSEPSVSGQTLTWTLSSVSVPHGGSVTLHFGVTVTCTAGGPYTNSAGGTATGTSVVPVTDTAPVTVTGSCGGPAPDTTSLVATAASTQYSDPVTLSATLTDTSTSTVMQSTAVTFTFNSTSYPATTNSSGVATATVPQVLLAPGSYPFTVAYAGDSTHAASNGGNNVVVSKEDCTLSYTGDTTVPIGSATNLAGQFGELDTTHGAWTGKAVEFQVTDGSATLVADPTVNTDATGAATSTQNLPAGVYSVLVLFAGDTYYNACQSNGSDLITVAAANALVTGGGFVVSNGHVNFGFNALSDAGVLSGQLQIRPGPHNRFHGDTVTSLTATGNTATWTGTGRWNGTSGYRYSVSVVDQGSGGARRGDTISITILPPVGTTPVFSTGGPLQLKGGNITVH